jgi:hypothetical protein
LAQPLNIAHGAATRATTLQGQFEYDSTTFFGHTLDSVSAVSTGVLFDYFEQCMVAVTFSFQALEAYCNYVIARKVNNTYPVSRKKGEVLDLTAIEVERQSSTENKLAKILPDLLDVSSPVGKAVGQNFKLLKEKQDATIHIKSIDQAPRLKRGEDLDRTSLFMGFIEADVHEWPKSAVKLIYYFAHRDIVPDWLEHELERYEIPRDASK